MKEMDLYHCEKRCKAPDPSSERCARCVSVEREGVEGGWFEKVITDIDINESPH